MALIENLEREPKAFLELLQEQEAALSDGLAREKSECAETLRANPKSASITRSLVDGFSFISFGADGPSRQVVNEILRHAPKFEDARTKPLFDDMRAR